MHESAEKLKINVASAFGMADHLRNSLHEWIDSVEERLEKGSSAGRVGKTGKTGPAGPPGPPGSGDDAEQLELTEYEVVAPALKVQRRGDAPKTE
jgi:hypothetical protein